MKSRAGQSLHYAILIVLAAAILVPFLEIVLAALQPKDAQVGGLSIPSKWSWTNFAQAWHQGHFDRLTLSSIIIAICVVPLAVAAATLAGYGLAVLRPAGSRAITLGFVLGLTLPVELVVVALYYDLQTVSLTNSYLGVVLAESALFMPFGVYWMQTHFHTVPRELVEAGRLDGAQDFSVLVRLLLPVSWPAITTLSVLYFMWSWNQFLLVLILIQDPDKRTAPAGLGFFVGQYSSNVPLLAAASIIVMAPIVVVYLIFQRNFVAGISRSGLKG